MNHGSAAARTVYRTAIKPDFTFDFWRIYIWTNVHKLVHLLESDWQKWVLTSFAHFLLQLNPTDPSDAETSDGIQIYGWHLLLLSSLQHLNVRDVRVFTPLDGWSGRTQTSAVCSPPWFRKLARDEKRDEDALRRKQKEKTGQRSEAGSAHERNSFFPGHGFSSSGISLWRNFCSFF